MDDKKIIQFCLWTNCNNKCDFCYLQNVKIQNIKQKLHSISVVNNFITNNKEYDTIGLIGGEFFQGQLKGCKNEFFELIDNISSKNEIKQVWISATLMSEKQDGLLETIDRLKNKDLYICTSYDVKGRFKNEEIWWKNYRSLFNKVKLHTEIIYTGAFCDKILNGDISFITEINEHSFLNFKLPNIYIEDYLKFKNNITLDNYLKIRNSSIYMDNFFLNRKKFLNSINVLNLNKINVMNAILGHSNQDYTYNILPCGHIEKDKWNFGAITNAPCGHFWDGRSYIDSNKCALCDIKNFYN